MTRIVTSTYRYKRPPREKKPQAIVGPTIVTPAVAQRSVKPGKDNHPADPKSRIVQATKPKDRRKAAAWVDDGEETPPEVNAFFGRNVRPGYPLPPASE